MKKMLLGVIALCLGYGSWALCASAQTNVRGDWQSYGYNAGGGRYSPLTQITPENVSKLQVAWSYHMNPIPSQKLARIPFATTTPLVVGNRMFLGTPYGRVVALDSTNGKQLWAYDLPTGDQPPFRGLAYWPGDKGHAPRLIFGTLRGRMIALDAASGAPSKGFGTDGIIDTKTPEIMNGLPNAFYGYSAPPTIYKNIAITGSRVQESPAKGAAGDARAWDVITGKLVWTFRSVPRPGEKFHETWEDDGWKQVSGVNIWNLLTVDTARGIAYLPFGAPTFDRYGGDHKGANLFSNTLVAVNASTGKYLWHFQVTHHDIWDLDLHTAPVLLTVKKDGKSIPAVAVMNKTAMLFLLNRVTGEPIFGVEERPVPPSSIPTEAAWPTQPFPLKPEVMTRMAFDLSEVANNTPEHKAICEDIIKKGDLVGMKMYEPLRADKTQVRFPGAAGGPEWGGGAFDPKLGLFIFNSNEMGYVERLVKREDGEWHMTTARFVDPKTQTPCHIPPWGELIAVDVNKAEVVWRSRLGVTDHFPEGQKDTGRASNGGPIVTASGLTFIAGTDDARFRAFDSKTGKEIWTYKLDHSAHATPITYRGRDGRQFVAVVATGGSYLNSPGGGDSLMVFALPK